MHDFVFSADLHAIEDALLLNPALANSPIALPDNTATAHPLHRICDGVFNGLYSEATGIELAKLFLKYGSDVNIDRKEGEDSPLTAACSLRCDQLALLYIAHEAHIQHRGCHSGTALHWAAWCGRDIIVNKLVKMNAEVNQMCIDFKSTPLFWAIRGYRFGGKENRYHQVNCVRILLAHGADPSIPNAEGILPLQLLDEQEEELRKLLKESNY